MLQVAHLIDFDCAAGFLRLNDGHIRLLHPLEVGAHTAGAAGNAGGGRLGTVDRLGKAQGQSTASHARRAGEEVRVAHLSADNVLLQELYGPFVAFDVPFHRAIVARADIFYMIRALIEMVTFLSKAPTITAIGNHLD